ncbi:MAG: GGDEF domain-containing protein [Phycisphaeraceae bacterium]|nr:GGDEF domain-containing protein [Phycisphaeraceae bacterium]
MSSHGEQARRVILVGRTGLDAKLRLDPELELLRVRNPMEAIAELADPIDDQSPARAVVVFGEGAMPGTGERADESLKEVVAGLRLVDPAVDVMLTSPAPDGIARTVDAVLDASRPAEEIREQIRSPRKPQSSEEASQPSAHDRRNEAPSETEELLQSRPEHAMAAGNDPVAVVLRGIATELGVENLRVERGLVENGAAIVWGGAVVGTLLGEGLRPERLALHTATLAPWVALREQMRRLRLAAYSDPLTGAWNRRYFDQFLGAALQIASKQRHSVTVLVFDIDDFKSFNDRFGHQAGDDILKETVRLLRSVIRPTDRVCRIGGDEFAVIFNEPEGPRDPASRHPKTIYQIAARFQQQVREAKFPKLTAEAPATLRISGGLATYPWDGLTATDLVCKADERAMEGKRQGKNVIMLGPGVDPA